MKTPVKKQQKSDIDKLFDTLKPKKKIEKEKVPNDGEKQQTKQVAGSKDDIFGEGKIGGRKKTEEGYNIYTEDELGFSKKSGLSDLCPFDCDCCF